MGKPHPHRELIHKWADGAEIQVKRSSGWEDLHTPNWDEHVKYRIKPILIKKTGWINIYQNYNGNTPQPCSDIYDSKTCALQCSGEGAIATVQISWEELSNG